MEDDSVEKVTEKAVDHAPPEPPKETEHVKHVTHEEFEGLRSTVDGLIQKVTEIVPAPSRDEVPTRKPWTHWGGHK